MDGRPRKGLPLSLSRKARHEGVSGGVEALAAVAGDVCDGREEDKVIERVVILE